MSRNREIPQRVILAEQSASDTVEVVAKDLEYFDSVTPEGAGALRLHGSIFQYVDIDSQTDENVVKYINPDTGVAFVDQDDADGKSAGWYEKLADYPVQISMPAGIPVYGRFSKVAIPSGDTIGSVVITNG